MSYRQLLDLVLLGALWGASFLFIRVAVPEFGVLPLIELRVLVGALVLLPFMLLKYNWKALEGHWQDMAIVGIFNSALPFALLAYALVYMTAGMGAIFNATVPMFTAVVAYIWLRERMTRARVMGTVLGIIGVIVLVWGEFSFQNNQGMFLAILAALGAALSYSISATYTRQHLVGFPSLITACISLIIATVLLTPLGLWFWPAQMPSITSWVCVIALGSISTGLAYILFFRLISDIGATKAVTVTFIIPLFATLWGGFFLQESLTLQMLIGGGIVILGTALSTGSVQLVWLERKVV